MNSSLWSADRMTHIKIVVVSLAMTAIVAMTVGTSIRINDPSTNSAKNYVDRRPVVAGEPVSLSAAESSTIR
jgi:hypothetical protein